MGIGAELVEIVISNPSYRFVFLVLIGVAIFLVLIGVAIFLFVFWILMIVDAAKRDFKKDSERVVWILILIFLGGLGAIIYYFAVKRD